MSDPEEFTLLTFAFLCGIAFTVLAVVIARLIIPELHWFL